MIPTWIKRYRLHLLKYAGEFVIIFSSITFTWWFDEWRQAKSDRKEEELLLTNLQSNLKLDSLNLVNELNNLMESEVIFEKFLDKLRSNDLKNTDSSGYLIRRLIIAPEFHPNRATFEAIKATGELKLIKDDSLTQEIMNHYEVTYQELNFLIDIYNKTATQTNWNYTIENHDLTRVLSVPKNRIYKLQFSSEKERKLLINKIVFTQMANSYSGFRINSTLEKIGKLNNRISKRLRE